MKIGQRCLKWLLLLSCGAVYLYCSPKNILKSVMESPSCRCQQNPSLRLIQPSWFILKQLCEVAVKNQTKRCVCIASGHVEHFQNIRQSHEICRLKQGCVHVTGFNGLYFWYQWKPLSTFSHLLQYKHCIGLVLLKHIKDKPQNIVLLCFPHDSFGLHIALS